jgi:hypothetical protein
VDIQPPWLLSARSHFTPTYGPGMHRSGLCDPFASAHWKHFYPFICPCGPFRIAGGRLGRPAGDALRASPKIVAGRGTDKSVLGAPTCPLKILGPGFHTGGPKMSALKNVQHKCNSNSNTYIFMKCTYNIVYKNKLFITNLNQIGNSNIKYK